jgi:predicted amidohydrolase YtcJ
MHALRSLAGALCAALLAGCGGAAPEPADLILVNGNLVTLDETRPEAQALAARDGRIVAVGSDAEIEPLRGPGTRVIDLEGRLAIPGFIEGHGHFMSLGESLLNLDLRGAATWEAVAERVARAAAEASPGEWIVGRGWHQDKWDRLAEPSVEGYPVHDLLDRAAPDNPVLLEHASGHAAIANALALELSGIDAGTANPEGGKILRDDEGRPTGVLRETASGLVERIYAEAQARLTDEQRRNRARRAAELAADECLSNGVTSFQDAGSSFDTVDLLREMAGEGRIGVRLWVMLGEDNAALAERIGEYHMVDAADGHLTVRAIKRSIDGALGTHGAWLLEPYVDLPETVGLNAIPLEELERTAEIARNHGFQLCVHAIGDRGNRETLDIFERVAGDPRALRWRIEHAQHLNPDDVPRFAALGVVASMQTVHCTSDASWVPDRLGDRRAAEGAYVWRTLIDSGAVVSNGTDVPVEEIDPIANFHAAVTRAHDDDVTFYPEQRMTREEALRAATLHAAFAAFEEDSKGSLSPGKLADVVVLSENILTVSEEKIREAGVVYTVVGGEVVYSGAGE